MIVSSILPKNKLNKKKLLFEARVEISEIF